MSVRPLLCVSLQRLGQQLLVISDYYNAIAVIATFIGRALSSGHKSPLGLGRLHLSKNLVSGFITVKWRRLLEPCEKENRQKQIVAGGHTPRVFCYSKEGLDAVAALAAFDRRPELYLARITEPHHLLWQSVTELVRVLATITKQPLDARQAIEASDN